MLSNSGIPSSDTSGSLQSEPSDSGVFGSDVFDFDTLQYDQRIMRSAGQIDYWFETARGRTEFDSIFEGAPKRIANTQAATVGSNFLELYPDLASDSATIMEGFRRLVYIGWGIAVTSHFGHDWMPDRDGIDQDALADLTAQAMSVFSESSFTAVEWYGFESRKEKAVYRYILLPLKIFADDPPRSAELISLGQWCLKYGISLGRSQIKMQTIRRSIDG